MNIDIVNIGHYRVTSHGGRAYDMFNRDSGEVYKLNVNQYQYIRANMNVAACILVEDSITSNFPIYTF